VGSLCTNGTHPAPIPNRRKSITLCSFDVFRKRRNFLITRRSGVASDATRREAFAAEGCSRIPPPLPSKPSESKGSGGFLFLGFDSGVGAMWRLFCKVVHPSESIDSNGDWN